MRTFTLILLTALTMGGTAAAQTAPAPSGGQSACPPGTGANPPAIGKETTKPLSDQLAESKGVICPPAGVDPAMRQPPPQGGTLKVIPPPGSPGGNPDVHPK
jgi:hypothetical protein